MTAGFHGGGLSYPRMAKSLTAVGVGSGSDPDKSDQFYRDNAEMASRFIKRPS